MGRLRGNPWAVLAILILGFFMTLIDLTIVNIAIPKMTDDLGTSLDEVLWVVNAYTLVLAIFIISAGRLGDLRGKSTIYLAGVALFTLASLACGLADGPGQLIAFRAVQGLGAAMLIPQTLSLIAEIFPAEKRGVALGIWGGVAGLSGAVGPTIGGVLVENLSWRWVFYVNLPIGVVALLAGMAIMPRSGRAVRHRYDVGGVLLVSALLFCLTFALIEGERYDWNGWIWALLGASAVLLAVFLGYEATQQDKEPLLPFTLFRDRNFAIVNFVGVAVSFGVLGLLLPTTIYLQSVLEFSALKTGLVLVPLAIGSVVTAGPAGVLAEKFGGRLVLALGLTLFGAGITWVSLAAGPDSGTWTFIPPLFVAGLGAGCTFAPMASEVMRNVPVRLVGAASGVNNALRQVGSVVAGAIVAAVLQSQLISQLRDHAESGAAALPAQYRGGFVDGFTSLDAQALQVGTGHATSGITGVPEGVMNTIAELSDRVFRDSFVQALQPTMLVPAGVMFVGAICCLALKPGPPPAGSAHGLPVPETGTETDQSGTGVRVV